MTDAADIKLVIEDFIKRLILEWLATALDAMAIDPAFIAIASFIEEFR